MPALLISSVVSPQRAAAAATDAGSVTSSLTSMTPGVSRPVGVRTRSEEHTSELQSLMRNSYAVFFLKKKKFTPTIQVADEHHMLLDTDWNISRTTHKNTYYRTHNYT